MFSILYLIMCLISLVILSAIKMRLANKIVLIATLFGIMGALIQPRQYSILDISRYFGTLDTIRLMRSIDPLSNILHTLLFSSSGSGTLTMSSAPVMGIILIIFSCLPNCLFLAAVTFCDIYFSLKIIETWVRKYHLSRQFMTFSAVSFFALFIYSSEVSGVRTYFVIVVMIYFLIKKLEKWTKLTFSHFISLTTLAFILMLIHPFAFVMYVIAVLTLLSYRNKRLFRIASLIVLLQHFYQSYLFKMLQPFSGIPFISSILFKSNQYFGDSATITIGSKAMLLRNFARLAIFMIIILLVTRYTEYIINRRYKALTVLFFCLTIGSVTDQILFDRCCKVIFVMTLPYISLLPSIFGVNSENKSMIISNSLRLIMLFFVISLFDNLRAGMLSYVFM